MSRPIKIMLIFGAVCATAIAYYLVRPEPVVAQTSSKPFDYKPQKAVAESPADSKVMAGHCYCGDGLGYNVELSLNPDGAYAAEWHGCLGKYGEAAGDWKLVDGLVVFTPSKETDMMRDHLRGLEVLKFQGHWILLSTNQSDREFYDKWEYVLIHVFRIPTVSFEDRDT